MTDEEIKRVNLKQNKFHGEWNYTIVIIYKGRIRAADSVENLRNLMQLPSLEEIFSQLADSVILKKQPGISSQ